ncbi:Senescence-specific cysteine protease SAG39-like protein, partial [Drosera capensis]
MTERHEQWIKQYGRVYKNAAEKQTRFEIFKKNIEYIENMNRLNRSFSLGLNAFTDLTNEEFRASHNGYRRPASNLRSTFFKYENFTDVPSSVDWVANGAVTPVKNQGQCDSPYKKHLRAFSEKEGRAAAVAADKKHLRAFSEKEGRAAA